MGRPQKKGVPHFPLSVDFFSQDLVCALRSEFGLKGEITLVKMLCQVFRHGYYLKWNTSTRMHLLGQLPGVNSELLSQIVQRLVKWGYFDRELFREHKVLTNAGIQQQYFSLTRRRQQPRNIPYLLVSVDNIGVSVDINGVSVYNNSVSADNNSDLGEIPEELAEIIADIKGVSVDINGVSVYNNSVSADNNPVCADINPEGGVLSPSPPITPSTYKEKKITPIGVIKKKKGKNGGVGAGGAVGKEKSCAKKEKEVFVPPTLAQVQEYCRLKGTCCVRADRFLSYYSAVGWVTGTGAQITNWQAKLDEWIIKANDDDKGKGRTSGGEGSSHPAADNGLKGKEGDSHWAGSDI